ncbi:MAG: GIY-YIG nuclease family protein [Pseudomonadota bacterium]
MTAAQYSVYIVECSDSSLYTGIATDVARRLKEHAGNSRGAKYLRSRGPLKLVYAQRVGSRSLAQHLESRVKRLSRAGKLELIAGRLDLLALAAESQVSVDASSP